MKGIEAKKAIHWSFVGFLPVFHINTSFSFSITGKKK
jgi:hypothetical protein